MKSNELLEYMIDTKARGEKMPSLKAIGKEFKVSAVAIHKNLKYLLNKGLIKKVGFGKYEVDFDSNSLYWKDYLIKRVAYLEKENLNLYQNNLQLGDINEDLEHSYNEMRKSLEFVDKQGKIKDKIIKAQEERIKVLESGLKESRFRKLLKKIGFGK